MTADLHELVADVTNFLDPDGMTDYAINGLQVDGGERAIDRIAVGVSANMELLRAAAEWEAQALLVHHGLYWFSDDPENDPARPYDDARASVLREHRMSLLAWHLPLDAHPLVGNNVGIARRLGLDVERHDFGCLPDGGPCVGVIARAVPPRSVDDLANTAHQFFGQIPLVASGTDRLVERVGIISGGGAGEIYSAIAEGVDAYISGEGREWIPGLVREAGIHFLALGHHASEAFGVQDLATWIADRHNVQWRFFPQDNPF